MFKLSLFSIFLTAIGLSMDAFAVSLTIGMSCRSNRKTENALRAGVYFGLFQGIMPLIGYFLSVSLAEKIDNRGGIIAFAILVLLGVKMIYEALHEKDMGRIKSYSCGEFFILAVATSIDALAVGISFALIRVKIVLAVCVISLTTFAISFCAVLLGKRAAKLLGKRAEVLGGIILILIGIKIMLF